MTATSGFIQNKYRPITSYSEGHLYSQQGSKLQGLWNKVVSRFRSSVTIGQAKRDLANLILALSSQTFIEKNYDVEGADKLELTTVFNALTFADLIPNWLPTPEVDIDPDGEISFEWYQSPDKLLSISIGQDGRLAYAGRLGIKKISGIDYLGEQFPDELSVFIQRIF
jgi:hypothetical protein